MLKSEKAPPLAGCPAGWVAGLGWAGLVTILYCFAGLAGLSWWAGLAGRLGRQAGRLGPTVGQAAHNQPSLNLGMPFEILAC